MLLSLRKNGLTSLFKEVRVFKAIGAFFCPEIRAFTGRDFFKRSKVLSDRKVLFKHKTGR